MQEEKNKINWQKPHHAYFLIGDKENKDFFVDLVSKNMNFAVSGNPDFSIIDTPVFGIDDARDLSLWVLLKPFQGEKKIKIIITGNITSESQNALLKVLEEPSLGSYIFFVLPNVGNLFKTLLSRVIVVDGIQNTSKAEELDSVAKDFLSKGVAERISMIQKLQKSDNKDVMKNLIREVEVLFYKKIKESGDIKNKADLLKLVSDSNRFVSSRGASSKMILENLSCILPVI